MKKRTALAAGIGAALAASPALAAVVTFDTPGELTGRFALNTNNGLPVKFTQVASGGLGGSGAVNYLNTTESDHTTAVFNEQSFPFSGIGDSITVSHFLLRQDCTAAQTPWSHLGIVSDLGERLDGGTAANSYASVRMDPVNGAGLATDVILRVETKVNGGNRVRTTPGSAVSLTSGHWYFLSTTFAYTSASTLDVSAELEDWGLDGSAFQSTIIALATVSVGLTGLDAVNGDGSVFGAFRDFHEGGADLSDDFAVTPEPASLALVGLVLLVAGAGRRR